MSAPATTARGLLSPQLLLGMVFGVGLCLYALLPAAQRRAGMAADDTPSALSLQLLQLELQARPDDHDLRLRVAAKTLDAGQLDTTRQLLRPLGAPHTYSPDARRLAIALERQALFAVDAGDTRGRDRVAKALRAHLQALDAQALPEAELQHMAGLAREVGERRVTARLLGALPFRPGHATGAHVLSADAAYLEAGLPLEAARLRSWFALRSADADAVEHALSAIAHARSADQPAAARRIYGHLAPHFDDPRLDHQGIELLAGYDDRRALALAEHDLTRDPADLERVRRVARLARFAGRSHRALQAYRYLAYHGGSAADRADALSLARAEWDLPLVLALSRAEAGGGMSLHAVLDRVALWQSLGDSGAALHLLRQAVAGDHADQPALWELQVQLLVGRGDVAEAAATLGRMAQRLGATSEQTTRRAELLLLLGRVREARDLLGAGDDGSSDAGGESAERRLRTLARLSLELGDLPSARNAYAALAQQPAASASDAHRYVDLERATRGEQRALGIAVAGYERHGDPQLLALAIECSLWAPTSDDTLVLLARAERELSFAADPDYWALRVGLAQGKASDALLAGQPDRARRQLDRAHSWLRRAEGSAPSETRYASLWDTQHAQTLSLALSRDDTEAIARAYPLRSSLLPARQRVAILHRLGRDEEALSLALTGARDTRLRDDDREALVRDASALADEMPRRAWVDADVRDYALTTTLATRVGVEYALWPRHSLLGEVGFTDLSAGHNPYAVDQPHELSARLGLHADRLRAGLGVSLRDGGAPRPSANAAYRLIDGAEDWLAADLTAHGTAPDTVATRSRGARDTAGVRGRLSLPASLYLGGRLGAIAYYTRDRGYRGAGATAEAALGRTWALLGRMADLDARIVGYAAPRVPTEPEGATRLTPEGTAFSGVGASLSRGRMDGTPFGPALGFIVDGSVGYLWPQSAMGFSGRAGLSLSLGDADRLSLQAEVSNVVGAQPGDAVWGAGVRYSRGLWR